MSAIEETRLSHFSFLTLVFYLLYHARIDEGGRVEIHGWHDVQSNGYPKTNFLLEGGSHVQSRDNSKRFYFFIPAFLSLPCRAQDDWKWPEKPKNLQVLNKDWPGSRLSPVMRGFTRALGVRCTYCHVGEEGKPLITYDFASDDNPNKDRAREMLRMLSDINERLTKVTPSGDKRVNMWCHTCHRGRPRPMTLAEELSERNRLKGPEAMLAHYRDLKKTFLHKGDMISRRDH